MNYKTSIIIILLSFMSCSKEKIHIPNIAAPTGMVWIPSGTFMQGADENDQMALDHEFPRHEVEVAGFFMDITEVTNKQFAKFVKETKYVTVAERPIDWNEIKKQVPPGTAKPPDSLLQPGSLLFKKPLNKVFDLRDFSQWWKWSLRTNWKEPQGPGSSIIGKDNYPVVHIAYVDAVEYCKWANRRLPSESEWEYASRANKETIYTWGNNESELTKHANTWTGDFPNLNTKKDGFEMASEVKSFPKNAYSLYDMTGNVWEWTSDDYMPNYLHKTSANLVEKRKSNAMHHMPFQLNQKVIKGGSFLCHKDYCASYRISARMNSDPNSSSDHIGFRTVVTVDMLQK